MENEKLLSGLTLGFVGNAEDDFEEALKKHMELHEGVDLFDLLKFLYQSALGSLHLLEMMDQDEIEKWIKKNLEKTSPSDIPLIEKLYGEKWTRLNFGPYKKTYGNDHQKIFAALAKAKELERDQPEEFLKLVKRLADTLRKKKICSITEEAKTFTIIQAFLKEYEKKGCPPVHHSKSYISKNSSDYLVVPRSSIDEIIQPNERGKETAVTTHDLPSHDIVKRAVEFHGHLGPFLVLGVKAGLLANSRLEKDYFKTVAFVTTDPNPPKSCFVDGIQFATGCTMGKRNIKLRKGKGISVLFIKEGRKLRLTVKKETLETLSKIKSEREAKEEAARLLSVPAARLFDTTVIE